MLCNATHAWGCSQHPGLTDPLHSISHRLALTFPSRVTRLIPPSLHHSPSSPPPHRSPHPTQQMHLAHLLIQTGGFKTRHDHGIIPSLDDLGSVSLSPRVLSDSCSSSLSESCWHIFLRRPTGMPGRGSATTRNCVRNGNRSIPLIWPIS